MEYAVTMGQIWIFMVFWWCYFRSTILDKNMGFCFPLSELAELAEVWRSILRVYFAFSFKLSLKINPPAVWKRIHLSDICRHDKEKVSQISTNICSYTNSRICCTDILVEQFWLVGWKGRCRGAGLQAAALKPLLGRLCSQGTVLNAIEFQLPD